MNYRLRPASLAFLSFFTVSFFTIAGCLAPPSVGAAASPGTAKSHSPVMGAATNAELAKKIAIITGLLDGKLKRTDLEKRIAKDFADVPAADLEKKLKNLREALERFPESVGQGTKLAEGPERWMLIGNVYYNESRYIEASELFTRVLDVQSDYPLARALLARCFFFLGNRDRTVQELEVRLDELSRKQPNLSSQELREYVDALYAIGGAVVALPGASKPLLEKGRRAWAAYLEATEDSPKQEQVKKGLADIEAALNGEGRLAQAEEVRGAAASGGAQGVRGGAGSFAGGPAPKKAERVKNLLKDASPFDVAMANALDNLDARNAAAAMPFVQEALKLRAGDPLAKTAEARIAILTGDIDGGLRLYGEIIKRNPDFMPAWHYSGMAHIMSGSPMQAAKSWEHIQKADPVYFKSAGLARRLQMAQSMAKGQ